MAIDTSNFRVGMLGELWTDYEKQMIAPGARRFQQRALKQTFLAGVVAYTAAQAGAANTAKDAREFDGMVGALQDETMEMARALDADNTPCDCDVCRAERGDIGEDVRVKTFASGLSAEQATELARVIADFVAECGGGKTDVRAEAPNPVKFH